VSGNHSFACSGEAHTSELWVAEASYPTNRKTLVKHSVLGVPCIYPVKTITMTSIVPYQSERDDETLEELVIQPDSPSQV